MASGRGGTPRPHRGTLPAAGGRCGRAGRYLSGLLGPVARRTGWQLSRASLSPAPAPLLGPVARRTGWQLAEQTGEDTPDGIQRLLRTARWDADGVRADLQAYVVEHLGDPAAVLVVDETGLLKQGTKSVGVKRQDRGTAGRSANCQIGVFLAYASAQGRGVLDRERYLPEEWANDPDRRATAGVPEAVTVHTKPGRARVMLERAFAAGLPAAWVTGDEVYGTDGGLRRWLAGQPRAYVLAVARAHPLWTTRGGAPQQVRADAVVADLPAAAWHRLAVGAGSTGPRLADWACGRLPSETAAGWAQGLLMRRSVSEPDALAC